MQSIIASVKNSVFVQCVLIDIFINIFVHIYVISSFHFFQKAIDDSV